MEPEPAFVGRRGLFLLRVRGDQRGVDVDDLLAGIRVAAHAAARAWARPRRILPRRRRRPRAQSATPWRSMPPSRTGRAGCAARPGRTGPRRHRRSSTPRPLAPGPGHGSADVVSSRRARPISRRSGRPGQPHPPTTGSPHGRPRHARRPSSSPLGDCDYSSPRKCPPVSGRLELASLSQPHRRAFSRNADPQPNETCLLQHAG